MAEEWARKIPRIERDQPLLVVEGRAYTPNEVVAEVRSGTETGRKLASTIEREDFTDIVDEYGVAVERLRKRLGDMPESMVVATLSGERYTPSEVRSQVDEGTSLGRALIAAEVSHIHDVLKKRR